MTLRDLLASIVRTVVPALVGLLLGLAAKAGLDIDSGVVTTVVDGVCVGGYYSLVRLLERRWPRFGWLLGWKIQLNYRSEYDLAG